MGVERQQSSPQPQAGRECAPENGVALPRTLVRRRPRVLVADVHLGCVHAAARLAKLASNSPSIDEGFKLRARKPN